jgi:hypothetical protein
MPIRKPRSEARARHCTFPLKETGKSEKVGQKERAMNEDKLNTSVRKFLKEVGVTSQREIEKAVREAVKSGKIKGNETLPAKMTLTVGGIGLSWTVDGDIELE